MFFLCKSTLKMQQATHSCTADALLRAAPHTLSSALFDFKASAPTRQHTSVQQAPACPPRLQQSGSALPARPRVHSKIRVHWERQGPPGDKMSPLFFFFSCECQSVASHNLCNTNQSE